MKYFPANEKCLADDAKFVRVDDEAENSFIRSLAGYSLLHIISIYLYLCLILNTTANCYTDCGQPFTIAGVVSCLQKKTINLFGNILTPTMTNKDNSIIVTATKKYGTVVFIE